MTRRFNSQITCKHCGKSTTAESGFGRWMRDNPKLDSALGIVRTDMDHIILRYKTNLDGKAFQLMMIVEVKEYGAESSPDQVDILSFIRQIAEQRQQNMWQRINKTSLHRSGYCCFKLKSFKNSKEVSVRFCGVHLLQFEKTSPGDSAWIKWDRKPITVGVLEGLIALERRPDRPDKMMLEFLRDRHRKNETMPLPL